MTRLSRRFVSTLQAHVAASTNEAEEGSPAFRSFTVGAYQIAFHDQWGKCLINGREVTLTATQYQMVSLFFHLRLPTPCTTPPFQNAEKGHNGIREHETVTVVAIVPTPTLQTQTVVANRALLRKYISMTNSKLRQHDLRIMPADRGNFYLLIAGSTLSEEEA